MRRTLVAMLFAALLHSLPAVGADPERHDADPENLFAVFVFHVTQQQYGEALDLFAYREQARHFDMFRMAAKTRFLALSPGLVVPYDQYLPLNEAHTKGQAAETIHALIRGLLLPEKYAALHRRMPYLTEKDEDAEQAAAEIVAALDPARLGDLQLLAMEEVVFDATEHAEDMVLLQGLYGYDERRDYRVEYRLGASRYLGGLGMIRYGTRWRIGDLRSPLVDTDYFRVVRLLSSGEDEE